MSKRARTKNQNNTQKTLVRAHSLHLFPIGTNRQIALLGTKYMYKIHVFDTRASELCVFEAQLLRCPRKKMSIRVMMRVMRLMEMMSRLKRRKKQRDPALL